MEVSQVRRRRPECSLGCVAARHRHEARFQIGRRHQSRCRSRQSSASSLGIFTLVTLNCLPDRRSYGFEPSPNGRFRLSRRY